MSDIELVIKIPEEKYNYVKKQVAEGIDNPLKVYIANGTPIPKGHGRIIDESQVTGTFTWDNGFIECFAPTIIEADTESEERINETLAL